MIRNAIEQSDDEAEQPNPDDFPSAEGGPDRNGTYEPTYGYEPYWADGDWVFDKPSNINQDEQDGTGVKMCGIKCSRMYTE